MLETFWSVAGQTFSEGYFEAQYERQTKANESVAVRASVFWFCFMT